MKNCNIDSKEWIKELEGEAGETDYRVLSNCIRMVRSWIKKIERYWVPMFTKDLKEIKNAKVEAQKSLGKR